MAEALTGRPERFEIFAGLKHRRFPAAIPARAPNGGGDGLVRVEGSILSGWGGGAPVAPPGGRA